MQASWGRTPLAGDLEPGPRFTRASRGVVSVTLEGMERLRAAKIAQRPEERFSVNRIIQSRSPTNRTGHPKTFRPRGRIRTFRPLLRSRSSLGKSWLFPVWFHRHLEPEVHPIAVADNVLFAFNYPARVAPGPGGMSKTFPAPALLSASSTA